MKCSGPALLRTIFTRECHTASNRTFAISFGSVTCNTCPQSVWPDRFLHSRGSRSNLLIWVSHHEVSCIWDRTFVIPNSFHLSHSRVIAASMHPCCDFVSVLSYRISLLVARPARRTLARSPESSQGLKAVTGLQHSEPIETS